MPSGLTSKVSFSNWVMGGSLVTITRNGVPVKESHSGGAGHVVVTELDSDGYEIDKHVLPLSKRKKKKVFRQSNVKPQSESESDATKNKESPAQSEMRLEGLFCSFCGHKREECIGKGCHLTSNLAKEEPKIEHTIPKNTTERNQGRDTEWTEVQDDIIQAMKSENRPWKEIAAVVGSTKKEVQQRFKTLQTAKQANEKANNSVKPISKGLGINNVDIPEFDFDRLLLDEDSGAEAGASGNDAPFSTLTGYDGYSGSTKKNKKGTKREKEWFESDDSVSNWHKISPPGLSSGGVSPVDSFDMPPIPKQPPRYGEPFVDSFSPPPQPPRYGQPFVDLPSPRPKLSRSTHVNSAPPRLLPDLIWSTEDCHILEDLESRHTQHKWLQLQADFFNWTGRMVDASIIERKFKEDGFY